MILRKLKSKVKIKRQNIEETICSCNVIFVSPILLAFMLVSTHISTFYTHFCIIFTKKILYIVVESTDTKQCGEIQ